MFTPSHWTLAYWITYTLPCSSTRGSGTRFRRPRFRVSLTTASPWQPVALPARPAGRTTPRVGIRAFEAPRAVQHGQRAVHQHCQRVAWRGEQVAGPALAGQHCRRPTGPSCTSSACVWVRARPHGQQRRAAPPAAPCAAPSDAHAHTRTLTHTHTRTRTHARTHALTARRAHAHAQISLCKQCLL